MNIDIPKNGEKRKSDLWSGAALQLRPWAEERFLNRHDTYPEWRTNIEVPEWKRHFGIISGGVLVKHLTGAAVIGAYAIGADNQGKWVGIDWDNHGDVQEVAIANLAEAMQVFELLAEMGFHPLLEDSDGRGGYKLWIFFSERVSGVELHSFGRWLVRNLRPGLEVFPKQQRIEDGGYGNQMRLPGHHHKREHWSKFWTGEGWTEDPSFLLTIEPSSTELIPAEARTFVPPLPPRIKGEVECADDPFTVEGDYNIRAEWESVLPGWKYSRTRGGVEDWTRPGKAGGTSATINHIPNRFYVFSNEADPFEAERVYSKFQAYCLLEHDGDESAAIKALELLGYGVDAKLNAVLGEGAAGVPENPRPEGMGFGELKALHDAVEEKKTSLVESAVGNLLHGSQLALRAEQRRKERTFLAKGWIIAGKQHLLSGPAKMGKSTTLFDYVASALCLHGGGMWLNYIPVETNPVLILDYENEEDYIADNLEPMLSRRGYTLQEVGNMLSVVDPETMVGELRPFNEERIIACIKHIQQITGYKLGTFIVDTARPAFNAWFEHHSGEWEWSQKCARLCAEAIQRVCKATGWAGILVHHFNKAGNSPSGAGDWRGGSELCIDYRRDIDKPATLTFLGRSVKPPATLQITMDAKGVVLTGMPISEAKSQKKVASWQIVLDAIPEGEKAATTAGAILGDIRQNIDKKFPEKTVKEALKDFRETPIIYTTAAGRPVEVKSKPKGGKGGGYSYWTEPSPLE